MKKMIILLITIFCIFNINKFDIKALEIKNDESPFFSNFNIEEDYTYVGHYVDTNLSNIREGLMSYKRKHVYDFQISDHVFVKYEGDLYPYVQSQNLSLSVCVQTLQNHYIASSTHGIQIGIEDCNMGLGFKKTYVEILKESEFSHVNYNLNRGSNVLGSVPSPDALITGNNGTVVVYSKVISVKVLKTELRQTGPIWNVFWITSNVSEYFYDIHLNFTFLPITIGVRNADIIQTGSFYIGKLDESIKDRYIPK